jgi:hypothetical protein
MRIRIKPAGAVMCAAVLAALGFGTTQAFARAYPIAEGGICTTIADNQSCYQGCLAKYGEGAAGSCQKQPGFMWKICECYP